MGNDEPKEQPDESEPDAAAPQPPRRQVPGGPASRTEGALGLEMARLMGVNPRLLTAPKKPAADRPPVEEPAAADPGGEQGANSSGGGSDLPISES